MSLTPREKSLFIKLFNRGGYVLDFSTSEFDTFTMESINVGLCKKYGMSKGRSLTQFLQEAPSDQTDKLLTDLMWYYENQYPNFREETKVYKGQLTNQWLNEPDWKDLYEKCKSLLFKVTRNGNLFVENSISAIKEAFSSDYINKQTELMLSLQKENPTETIGKAKELIESCCKAILEANGVVVDKKWDIPELTKRTRSLLKITPEDIADNIPCSQSMKSLLGNLAGIANGIAELRNAYGSGHGKSPSYKGLEERHAKLAVGASLTLVNFLWDSHLRMCDKKKSQQ